MIKLTVSWEGKRDEVGQTSYEFDDDFNLVKLLRELTCHASKAWTTQQVLIKERHPRNPEEELPCVL